MNVDSNGNNTPHWNHSWPQSTNYERMKSRFCRRYRPSCCAHLCCYTQQLLISNTTGISILLTRPCIHYRETLSTQWNALHTANNTNSPNRQDWQYKRQHQQRHIEVRKHSRLIAGIVLVAITVVEVSCRSSVKSTVGISQKRTQRRRPSTSDDGQQRFEAVNNNNNINDNVAAAVVVVCYHSCWLWIAPATAFAHVANEVNNKCEPYGRVYRSKRRWTPMDWGGNCRADRPSSRWRTQQRKIQTTPQRDGGNRACWWVS